MRKYFYIFEIAHENVCGPSYFTKRKFIFENEKSSMGRSEKVNFVKPPPTLFFFSQVQNIFDGFSKKTASTLHILNR